MRTDRTWACLGCAARIAPADRCPRCGGAVVALLGVPSWRLSTRRGGLVRRLERLADSDATPLAMLVVLALALALAQWSPLPYRWVFPVVTLFFVAVVGSIRLTMRLARRQRRRRLDLLPAAASPDARVRRAGARGRIRSVRTVVAPLSRKPCVAFRIVGESSGGRIDDAGAASFAIDGDPAGPVRVELGEATIDLPVFGEHVRTRPSRPELRQFLAPRGLADVEEVRIAEACLAPGDEVEVEGSFEEAPVPSGYRDTVTERVFREVRGSPLVIRRAR